MPTPFLMRQRELLHRQTIADCPPVANAEAKIYAQYKSLTGDSRTAFYEKHKTALWDHYYAQQNAAS